VRDRTRKATNAYQQNADSFVPKPGCYVITLGRYLAGLLRGDRQCPPRSAPVPSRRYAVGYLPAPRPTRGLVSGHGQDSMPSMLAKASKLGATGRQR
jgi:hypothetical protein